MNITSQMYAQVGRQLHQVTVEAARQKTNESCGDLVDCARQGGEAFTRWNQTYDSFLPAMRTVTQKTLQKISDLPAYDRGRGIAQATLEAGSKISPRSAALMELKALEKLSEGISGPVGVALARVGAQLSASVCDRDYEGGSACKEAGEVARTFLSQLQMQGSLEEMTVASAVRQLSMNSPAGVASSFAAALGLQSLGQGKGASEVFQDVGQGMLAYYEATPGSDRNQQLYEVSRGALQHLIQTVPPSSARDLASQRWQETATLDSQTGGALLQEAFIALQHPCAPGIRP